MPWLIRSPFLRSWWYVLEIHLLVLKIIDSLCIVFTSRSWQEYFTYMIDWFIIYTFMSCLRTFHLHVYGDVTIAGVRRAAKFRPILPLSREGSLLCHSSTVTRDLGFSSLIQRTAFSHLLWHAWGCRGSTLTRIWRRHQCQWRAAKVRPMLGAQGQEHAGGDLYRATPAVTHGLSFSGLIWRTTPFSRLLRYTRDHMEGLF
jgi:hypothetical protein